MGLGIHTEITESIPFFFPVGKLRKYPQYYNQGNKVEEQLRSAHTFPV